MATNIALDAMGGDQGPEKLVAGAVQAVCETDITVTLLGDREQIRSILAKHNQEHSTQIHIVHTSQIISMGESPFEAIRKKRDSSIIRAFALQQKGEVSAVVSAGNSGATMAAAIKLLGRLSGISRPGIAGVYPTMKGPVVMMDVGANVDCRPQHLLQFAVMASAFSRVLFSVDQPRIGLLSIGEEGGKGNILVKKTYELLQKSSLNFIGNIEGRDTFLGNVDVIVCDGFVGNVCLKLSEGLAEAMLTMLGDEIAKSSKAKFGYLLAKNAFASFKKRVDYAEYGGGPLLGLKGSCIICHGRSNELAIKNAIKMATALVRNNVNDHIVNLLEVCDADKLSAEHNSTSAAPPVSGVSG